MGATLDVSGGTAGDDTSGLVFVQGDVPTDPIINGASANRTCLP